MFYFHHVQIHRVLVVCPLITILNWVHEFEKLLPPFSDIKVYKMVRDKNRMSLLKNWLDEGGVMIIGYDSYRALFNNKKMRSSEDERLVESSLVSPGPQLLICNEGHKLKDITRRWLQLWIKLFAEDELS